jgi:hypothetical protein
VLAFFQFSSQKQTFGTNRLTIFDTTSIIKTMLVFALPFHPNRLNAPREPLLEDLLEMAHQGKQDCVDKIISMLEDLHTHGFSKDSRGAYNCRFIKPFGGAIYELKAGKVGSGAARVYLIRGSDQCTYLTHAECKKRNAANEWMIANTLEIQDALEQGKPVFPEPQRTKYQNRLKRIAEES